MKNVELQSVLNQINPKIRKCRNLEDCQRITLPCLNDSGVNQKDKDKMISTFQAQTNLSC